MIQFSKHTLSNGLRLLLHEDHTTPLVSLNILYNVGARNEMPSRTGFAHLFEHLMFGGTPNVPDYDLVVNNLGGESNAFTNNDYTNYYLTVPAEALPQALELEADRMRLLDFSQRSLDVQKRVVTEEYNQRYVNQPYGDKWLLLRPLCYKVHPYRWCTIGSDIAHVAQASIADVEQFFYRYYRPNNAILSLAGNLDSAKAIELVEHYFADIQPSAQSADPLPVEPVQTARRELSVEREVPASCFIQAFHMPGVGEKDYYVCDLLSDVLSNGQSSRMYDQLVRQQGLFTELNAYITGESHPGLFVVEGRLADGTSMQSAEQAVSEQLCRLSQEPVSDHELQKVVNKYENTFVFSHYKASDRAMSLCYYEWLGHPDWVNDDPLHYRSITPADLQRVAANIFTNSNSNVIYYCKKNQPQKP